MKISLGIDQIYKSIPDNYVEVVKVLFYDFLSSGRRNYSKVIPLLHDDEPNVRQEINFFSISRNFVKIYI